MIYGSSRIFKVIGQQYDAHRKKMIVGCFAADGIIIPEFQAGQLKILLKEADAVICNLPIINTKEKILIFLAKLITTFGISKRTGDKFYISHAGCKAIRGCDIDWFLERWLDRAMSVLEDSDTDNLWKLLLDLEIIAPANSMNSTIAQILWSAIRYTCEKPPAFIPLGEIISYRDAIKRRRIDIETHFNFKQEILDN